MTTSFIMHDPDDKATLWEDGDTIEFHDLGHGISAIFNN